MLANHAVSIHHQDAIRHILYHQPIRFCHVGKIDPSLGSQTFTNDSVLSQGMSQPRHSKIGNTQYTHLQVLGQHCILSQHRVGMLQQHSNRRHRCKKQGYFASAD